MKVNANDQLDLKGSCLVGCNGTSLVYSYNIYMLQSPTTWVPFTNPSYFQQSGSLNSVLTVSQQLFADYPAQIIWKIELVLQVVLSANETYFSPSSMSIFVNFPPIPGTCDVFPKSGNTSMQYSIICNNWADASGVVVTFVFYGNEFENIYSKKF